MRAAPWNHPPQSTRWAARKQPVATVSCWPKDALTTEYLNSPPAEKNAQASGMKLYEITAYRHRGTSPWPHRFCNTTV